MKKMFLGQELIVQAILTKKDHQVISKMIKYIVKKELEHNKKD